MTRTTLNITTNPLQNVLYTIRKKLGYVKYVCLDGGHRDVRYRWQIDRLNRQAAGLLDRLARDRILKPAAVPMESNIELHTLCCHDHVTMGIWSIWSLVRWAEGRLSLVVHSDGSLTQDDVGRFRRVLYKRPVRLAGRRTAVGGEAVCGQ